MLALNSPIDALGEEHFFFIHMLQHVDPRRPRAALLHGRALTGPILQPVLKLPGVERLRILAHPLVALPVWALNLYIWHIPFLYDGALHHDAVHALEHFMFFTCGCLIWEPVVETLPAPAWFGTGVKIGYIFVVRLIETVLGNVFMWTNAMFYTVYQHAPEWGITPAHDLNLGGIVMMAEGSRGDARRARLALPAARRRGRDAAAAARAGLDPRQVKRAVRYGRAKDLGASR